MAKKVGRLAFTPTPESRAFLDDLTIKLKEERRSLVRVTYRDAFDFLVYLAKLGEQQAQPQVVSLKLLEKKFKGRRG
jgi:hypothetical protein